MTSRRQRVGLLVLGVAVVLVAAAAGLRPYPVSGAARAAPVQGPPVVGDCVLDPVPVRPVGVIAPVTATSGGTVPVYPAQRIRPCTAARYGEITAVITTPKPAVVQGDADNRYLDDPNENSCYQSASQYIGIPAELMLGFWQPAIQYSVALSRPSARQAATGQRWAACIVTLRPLDSNSTTPTALTAAAPHYGGSIRDALHTGQQRNHLSSCLPVLEWNGEVNTDACERPHALEIMAFGDSGEHPVTRSIGADLSAAGPAPDRHG